MSRSSSPTGYDEDFVPYLKPFVSVSVAAEEERSLARSKKRIGKVDLDPFIWTYHSAVCEGWFVRADNDEINPFVLFKSLELIDVPSSLLLILFCRQGGEVGIDKDQPDSLPDQNYTIACAQDEESV